MPEDKINATASRDFNDYDDDGNPRRYVKGSIYSLGKGLFGNFEAVGLVTAAPADAAIAQPETGAEQDADAAE